MQILHTIDEVEPNASSIQAVRAELGNILGNRLFSSSPILCRFLDFIVEHKLAGKENELKEYTVGLNVLGKASDFNPRLDASVRIHANRLRKMLKAYYEKNVPVHHYRIELPTGHYRPVFRLVLQDLEESDQLRHVHHSKNLQQDEEDTICILPFTGPVTRMPGGISLELPGAMLSQKISMFQDVTVRGYAEVLKYYNNGGTTSRIGRDLGVKYYLAGNIDIEEDLIQITISLFKAINNEFVVSLSCEEKKCEGSFLQPIEHITSRIASSVADYSGLVHIQNFSLAAVVPLSGILSHAVFWHYKYLTNHRKEVFAEALVQMKQAVIEYPESALSWAVLGHLLADGVVYHYLPARPNLEKALVAASKSLDVNPNCQHGHIAMGWVMLFSKKPEKAIYHFKRSISINPHSTYFKTNAGLGLAMAGDYETSISHMDGALKLNPMPGWWVNLPYVLVCLKNKDFEKMLFYSRKVSTPSVVFEHVFEMIALYYLGKKTEVIKLYKTYKKAHPGGLEFVMRAIPDLLIEEQLAGQVVNALQQIWQLSQTRVYLLPEAGIK